MRVFSKDKVLRRVLRRERFIEGAQKGARKAETRPFAEYDPLRVHPDLGKGVGLFKNVRFLEILESSQSEENKGDSDHFLEIPEKLEILESGKKKEHKD